MLNNENVNYWDLVLVSMLAQHIDPCVILKKKKKTLKISLLSLSRSLQN